MIEFLMHTPTWVFVLLAALVGLGLSQRRDRLVSPLLAALLPVVMLAFSLQGLRSAFGSAPGATLAWAAGAGLALAVNAAAGLPRGATWSPSARRVLVPGSSVPLLLLLGIFLVRYALGAASARAPGVLQRPEVPSLAGLALGLLGGLFLARAVRVLLVAHRAAGTAGPARAS
jgi:hypothetical protein